MPGCYPKEVAGHPRRHGLLISPESGFVEAFPISEVHQGLNIYRVIFVEYSVGINVVDIRFFDVDNFADFVSGTNETTAGQKVCATAI